MTSTSPFATLEYALRVCESIAFSLHAVLGITEPCTGCLRAAFKDGGAMPSWFWPVAGCVLVGVAFANFSSNDTVVLANQFYIAAFHTGAVLYHLRLGHSLAIGIVPGFFVVIAFAVAAIRAGVLTASLGLLGSFVLATVLCHVLVTPPNETSTAEAGPAPEARAATYLLESS